MTGQTLYNGLDLVSRGYNINPDWNRDFREDQDKVTKVVDEIINIELGEYINNNTTTLSEVYFTKYWSWRNYCMVYKMKDRYNNVGILIGSILESTDNVLRWYDLTTNFNFNIVIVTPYETFRFTYLDLLYEYITMSDGKSISVLLNTHPRVQQMEDWVVRNPRYQRVTQKIKYSNHPYSIVEKNGKSGWILQLRDDVDYRSEGIQQGYYDYHIRGEDFYQQVQQISQYYNGGHRQEESIVERVSLINRLRKILKI